MSLWALKSGQPARLACCPERAREPSSENSSPHSSGPGCLPHILSALCHLILITTLADQEHNMCLWKKLAMNISPADCKPGAYSPQEQAGGPCPAS